jgi:hypothetical protein
MVTAMHLTAILDAQTDPGYCQPQSKTASRVSALHDLSLVRLALQALEAAIEGEFARPDRSAAIAKNVGLASRGSKDL